MAPSRRKEKSAEDRGSYIIVDKVPTGCQWQELKDYLRDYARVRPGHTSVWSTNLDGTRMGQCPLPNREEANRAFEYLVQHGWHGADVSVVLATRSFVGVYNIKLELRPGIIAKQLPKNIHLMSTMPDRLRQHLVIAKTSIFKGPPSMQTDHSDSTESGFGTAQHTIHMSQLPADIKIAELEQLLSHYGHVRDVRVRNGPSKRCSAVARFERPEQARNAVATLHNRSLRGIKIAVKLDKYEHASERTPSVLSKDADSDSSSSRSTWDRGTRGTSSVSSVASVPIQVAAQPTYKGGPLIVDGAGGDARRRRMAITSNSGSDSDTDDN